MKKHKQDIIDVEVVGEDKSQNNGGTGYRATSCTYTQSDSEDADTQSGQGQQRNFFNMANIHFPGYEGMPLKSFAAFVLLFFGLSDHKGLPQALFITTVLLFFCLFKWGFLAALGFALFYVLGSVAGVIHLMNCLSKRRMPRPWLCRIVTWIVSTGLVYMLVR